MTKGAPRELTLVLREGPKRQHPTSTFVLTVVEGPDEGSVFRVDASLPQRVIVGTGPSCDFRLQDRSVSRRHAAVEVEGDHLAFTDLDSTNGTFINGLLVRDARLQGGEQIVLGTTSLQVARGPELSNILLPFDRRFGSLVGASFAMQRLYPVFAHLAGAEVPLVIEGETGTGKECLAESLHQRSPRASQPFVVFDCTAVAPTLLESELFGHERGAFTGAVASRPGLFERAHGGTLLIDEIGDMPLPFQPKLLRAIERAEVRRVGGNKSIKFDVRLMVATRRNLDLEVQQGRFRDDLYHRLAVTRVELPPLRKRIEDLPLLVAHFATSLGASPDSIPAEIVRDWMSLSWPGNVRELRNAVARWLALGDMADEDAEDFVPASRPHLVRAHGSGGDSIGRILSQELPLSDARQMLLDEFESRYVERLLDAYEGNVTRAAAAAGVGRRYFQRLKARLDGRQ